MRPEKISIIEEIKANIAGSSFVILIDYRGMKAGQANELRKRLRDQKARLQIVKNNYLARAVEGTGRERFAGAMSGPIAIVVGRGDPVAVSRLLKMFRQEHELPALKMGICEGYILSAEEIDALTNLPSRRVLQAILVGLIASPLACLAGVMRRRLESILYLLKAVEEKKKGSGTG